MTGILNAIGGTRARPDDPAIILPDVECSYKELVQVVDKTASRLEKTGLKPTHRVLIRAGTQLEELVLLLACFQTGVLPCVIHPRTPTARVERFREICGCCGELGAVARGGDLTPQVTFREQVSPGFTIIPELPAYSLVVFTSGSLGEPKAAVLSADALRHNANLSNQNIPLAAGDRWLLSVPLCHVSGLGVLFRCFTTGAAIVTENGSERLWEPLARYRVTHVSVVPTQLHRLLATPAPFLKRELPEIRCVLVGGAPIPERLLENAVARGLPVQTTYGLTEMCSQVTTTRPSDSPTALTTCGYPLEPGSVDIDTTGEIKVKGSCLFSGYLDERRLTLPVDEQGWFATKDLGAWDNAGRLLFRGRKDLLFRCAGEFVSPEEIEREIAEVETVEQVVVVPRADPEYGECPVAVIKLTSGANELWRETISAIRDRLNERLPGPRRPREYLSWPAIFAAELKADRKSIHAYVNRLSSQKE